MLNNLKKNHRYTFYQQIPNSEEIKKFRAVVVSIADNTLLVHSYETEDQLYENNKKCVWSIPCNWIKKVDMEEDDIVDHDDIFTEIIVLY